MRKPIDAVAQREFDTLLKRQRGVVRRADAVRLLGESTVRWRTVTGRWQVAHPGVVATQSGPLSPDQLRWAALLAAGSGAVLAGLTAANCDGLAGVTTEKTWILVPHGRQVTMRGGPVVRSSTQLGPDDVHPVRLPPRTRIARSIVDACRWAPTDNHARLILASALQQRLVRGAAIRATLGRLRAVKRSKLIHTTLADVEGGSHSLPELDFTALLRTFGLPEPDRQAVRRDSRNLARWLDAYFEKWRVVVEIDGLWHMDAGTWWADIGTAERARHIWRPSAAVPLVRDQRVPGRSGSADSRRAQSGRLDPGWRVAFPTVDANLRRGHVVDKRAGPPRRAELSARRAPRFGACRSAVRTSTRRAC